MSSDQNTIQRFYTRSLGDIDTLFDPTFRSAGGEVLPLYNARKDYHSIFRSYLKNNPQNRSSCRNSGDIPYLVPHNYALDRPIQFSNDIRVAYLQYQALLEKSHQMAIEELSNQSNSYTHQMKQYEKQKRQFLEQHELALLDQRTIPEAQTIAQMADDVSHSVIKKAYPQVASKIKYLTDNEPNMDIVKYLEAGFQNRDLLEDGVIDRDSQLWHQFVDVYQDAKMLEGIQYVHDLTGENYRDILDDYANDFFDLQKSSFHKKDARQYHIEIPPQWASPEVHAAARWINQQRLLQSGDIPELIPFNHHRDRMEELNEIAEVQQDEMLTQASLLAASATSNFLDYLKDTSVIEALTPYIQYEQNVLNLLTTANSIVFKNIFDKQSRFMEELRTYRPSLEIEAEILQKFDKDALERFNTMHALHKQLLDAYAKGAASRAQMFQRVRDNVNLMYHEWVNSDVSRGFTAERSQGWLENRMATEKKVESEILNMAIEMNSIIARDDNTKSARDAYIDQSQSKRADLLTGLHLSLLRTKEKLINTVNDEFMKLDQLMKEIDVADNEFALYVDKIEGLKLEWDRYSLLTKAAVIKALVLKGDSPEEADELLDSTNKAVLNMEYLKKVIHVISADLEGVSGIAGKRIHNAYCHLDPTLSNYQARDDRTDITYPMPEPYILASNIIIPQEHQYFQHFHDKLPDNPEYSQMAGDYAPTQSVSMHERIQRAVGEDPTWSFQSLNQASPLIPEDLELLDATSVDDRGIYVNPDTGTGSWARTFSNIMSLGQAEACAIPAPLLLHDAHVDIAPFPLPHGLDTHQDAIIPPQFPHSPGLRLESSALGFIALARSTTSTTNCHNNRNRVNFFGI